MCGVNLLRQRLLSRELFSKFTIQLYFEHKTVHAPTFCNEESEHRHEKSYFCERMDVLVQFRTRGVNTAGHSKAPWSVLRNNHCDRYGNAINRIAGIQYDTAGESYLMRKLEKTEFGYELHY